MKQPDKRTPFLFITLGIVTILLLLIDMATGDTYIPITKVWAVLTGGECDEIVVVNSFFAYSFGVYKFRIDRL